MTKNTTAVERRIARRQQLADTLGALAVSIEKLGASGALVREAATELLIGNCALVLAGDPEVTEAMIGRALDGWDQFGNGFTGVADYLHRRAAMRHALEQALGVRP